jgi:predicted nucleotidyltransferase component of viral defense system
MISKHEILSHAEKRGVSANVIEKDYVLGWLIYGIARFKELSKSWFFKGGTCIKKCYIENYRFSEDCVPRKH